MGDPRKSQGEEDASVWDGRRENFLATRKEGRGSSVIVIALLVLVSVLVGVGRKEGKRLALDFLIWGLSSDEEGKGKEELNDHELPSFFSITVDRIEPSFYPSFRPQIPCLLGLTIHLSSAYLHSRPT